ncbi:hypothetical protein [Tardiphaga sp. P9-11]|uniref:hypothetical protein n=1 Tax=Tardiphaga sp. P9-11 TaxID=2024614 RepID=UPI0011F23CB2|nr:hypothetical protein [Tardiphaga sp. P9-11]KAA0072505.1 hypothetical protein CIW50_24665 [Tardiphaga sp. P9-11]
MAKHPDEHKPSLPLSKEEREARKVFRQVEAEQAINDHEAAQKAFSKNHERLKAERLAREAASQPAKKKKPARTKKIETEPSLKRRL